MIPQIESILAANFLQIMHHLERKRDKGYIADIEDSEAYKKIASKHPNKKVLSLTMNIDGANIFKSSKNSLWLTQVCLQFLPPAIRFLLENILIVSLFYGSKKPNVFDLVSFMARELDECELSIFDGKEFITFVPALVTISCDLLAKAMVQNMKNATGKYACSYCYHPGTQIKNLGGRTTTRYVKRDQLKSRTHDDTIQKATILSNKNNLECIDGVKGISCALLFNDFDIIHNFAIDIMHGIALGIVKDVAQIWMGVKKIPNTMNNLKIKLKNEVERMRLNKRLIQLKSLMGFKRKPRSIFELANYKATELLNFLLYYFRFTINDLLSTKVIKHFELLSAATFIICQTRINNLDLSQATDMLIQFADLFEEIYGVGSITMNVHLLRHYADMIRKCGPVWINSLFVFESNIRKIKNMVSGCTDVLIQITKKYIADKVLTVNNNIDCASEKTIIENNNIVCGKSNQELFQRIFIKVTQHYRNVFEQHGIHLTEDENMCIFRRLKLNKNTYTSVFSIETKSVDYFVEMNDGSLGIVEFYFEMNNTSFVFLNKYQITVHHYHLKEVSESNVYTISECKQIKSF